MADLSNYIVDELINHLLRNTAYTSPTTIYVSLHSAAPGETGANEVSTGSYARQSCAFNAPVDGVTANTSAVTFTGMPAGDVHSVGLWDASTLGNFIAGKALTGGTVTLPSGATFEIPAGDLDFTLG